MNHQENLMKAINLSKKSIDAGSSPFGAIIVDQQGNVIGEGHNRVVLDNDPTAHGEVMAIRNACKNIGSFDLSGCILFITSLILSKLLKSAASNVSRALILQLAAFTSCVKTSSISSAFSIAINEESLVLLPVSQIIKST